MAKSVDDVDSQGKQQGQRGDEQDDDGIRLPNPPRPVCRIKRPGAVAVVNVNRHGQVC